MIVERKTWRHKYNSCAEIFAILVYISLSVMIYNTPGRPIIILFVFGMISHEVAYLKYDRFYKKHRPKIYNISSKELVFTYYNKKEKRLLFEDITRINMLITIKDKIVIEIESNEQEILRMYGGDFEDFPTVFDAFIKLSVNAPVFIYSCISSLSENKTKVNRCDKSPLELMKLMNESGYDEVAKVIRKNKTSLA